MFNKASGHINGPPLSGWSTAKPTRPTSFVSDRKPTSLSAYARQRQSFLKLLLKRASEPDLPALAIPTVLQVEIAAAGGLLAWAERELPRLKNEANPLTWVRGAPKRKRKAQKP